jgi:hypothetical protein
LWLSIFLDKGLAADAPLTQSFIATHGRHKVAMSTLNKATTETLESLYVINKQAKKYRDKAEMHYNSHNGAAARTNSCRKQALYAVKDKILRQIRQDADRVAVHQINGDDFYCFYFEGPDGQEWSFHTPESEFDVDDERIEENETLENFESTKEKEATNRSLKDSLLHIEKKFGECANNHLKDEYVDYGRRSYFTGWSYLND